jgi:hypothetical protein
MDPEPWNIDEVEYALYNDINNDSDNETDQDELDTDDETDQDELDTDNDSVSTNDSSLCIKTKIKQKNNMKTIQLLQEETDFISEK